MCVEHPFEKFGRRQRKSILKSETGNKTIWIEDRMTNLSYKALGREEGMI